MRIAINTRFLLNGQLEGLGRFTYETSKWMVENHPEHEFFFLFDRPFDEKFIFSNQVKPLVIGPPARHPYLWYLWFEWQLPRILKKHKIDLFISPDGHTSLRTKVPTCTVIHDLAYLHFPEHVHCIAKKYYQKFVPQFAKKSTVLGTVSQASKLDLIKAFDLEEHKVFDVESACPEGFTPVDEEIRQIVKQQYTNGKSYFIYVGAIHPRKNVLRIIKAFYRFKKFYKTDMKLILVGRKAWKTNEFDQNLNSHPNKEDIIHLQNIPKAELVNLIGSSYASLYPSLLEGFGLPILEAQKCGVPIITSNNSSMPEVMGDAGLLVNALDIQDIADKMGMLYKDEELRDKLIQKGFENAKRYSWERTAKLLYECALKAIPN